MISAAGDMIGLPLQALPTPVLLIDAALLEANLAAMAARLRGHDVACRPHVKSHKSPVIAAMQIAAGAQGVCCAKLGEAEVMLGAGVGDVHITTPVVGRGKAARLARLAAAGRVSVVVDDAQNIAMLSDAARAAGATIDVLIEMDVGQGRCGVASAEQALNLAEAVMRLPGLRLRGLQGYHGGLQSVVAFDDRREGVKLALERLQAGADRLGRAGLPVSVLTGGGTGSLPIDLELGGLNELQPGSYVFMDGTYRNIQWNSQGGAAPFTNALTVLASVVSHPLRDRVVLDVGWKAVSCDSGVPVLKGETRSPVEFAGDEHSLLRGAAAVGLKVGDFVELVPSHCDTTVNLYDRFHVIRGGVVEAVWPISARGRSD